MDMGHDGETCAQVEREREEYAAELLQLRRIRGTARGMITVRDKKIEELQAEVRQLRAQVEDGSDALMKLGRMSTELAQLRADHERLKAIEDRALDLAGAEGDHVRPTDRQTARHILGES